MLVSAFLTQHNDESQFVNLMKKNPTHSNIIFFFDKKVGFLFKVYCVIKLIFETKQRVIRIDIFF